MMTSDESAAPDAPIIHHSEIRYRTGAPAGLEEVNRNLDPREGKVIYMFPIGGDPHKNIAASVSGGIGDIEK
ncbi:MAG TPA: hypothetical protein ENK97_03580, partial [Campylobacteraceae bacterium]|nr:hypothetical protein [Campylobacteraceae bacterium]